ncbi:AMP-binding protein, partial [Micromonospora sp. CPCC 205371]|nr:AMP-binding protein [Micromonospora sp. CPCC 205371]
MAEWATRSPDAVAVVAGGRSLTYGGLWDRAGRLAGHLRGLGVGRESVVGVCLPRDMDLVVALLGVWLAGGAYLPIDPEYPADRREFMLADAGADVLVTDVRAVDGVEPVCVPAEPGQLAYVIYTSGSTGRPKGVMVEHASVRDLFRATDVVFGSEPGQVWSVCHSAAFDFSVWEIWGAL